MSKTGNRSDQESTNFVLVHLITRRSANLCGALVSIQLVPHGALITGNTDPDDPTGQKPDLMRRHPVTVLTESKCGRKPLGIHRSTGICHGYASLVRDSAGVQASATRELLEIPLAFVTNRTLMLRQISLTFNSFGDKWKMQPRLKHPADSLGGDGFYSRVQVFIGAILF